ncbi:MAG: hypothetical protein AB6733_24535 [Clostridiaceae bacterium]
MIKIITRKLLAATVCTGGLALGVVAVEGTAAMAVGASEMSEGLSDYSKVQSGDFSKSYNFMWDTICGGNETLYKIVKYGSVLISGAAIGILSGGSATQVLLKIGKDMAGDVAINAIMDYAQDGKLDNSLSSYLESAAMSGAFCGVSSGVTSKIDKMKDAMTGADRCKKIGRVRLATDMAIDAAGSLATSGDINFLRIIGGSGLKEMIITGDCGYLRKLDGNLIKKCDKCGRVKPADKRGIVGLKLNIENWDGFDICYF